MKQWGPSISLLILAGCALMCPAVKVVGEEYLDFGAQVRALSGWEAPGSGAVLEAEPSVWLKVSFSPAVSLDARGRLLSSLETPYLFDLEQGTISIRVSQFPELDSSFLLQGGRFTLSDFSSYLMEHRVDGATLHWKFPYTWIRLSGGYTGWQPRQVGKIYLSKSDVMDWEDSSLTYAPRRFVEVAQFGFPSLFVSQDVVLSLVAQQDLRKDSPGRPPAKTDRVHTHYVGLGTRGPLGDSFKISLFGYLGIGLVGENSRLFSGMYGASVLYEGKGKRAIKGIAEIVSSSGDDRLSSIYDSATVKESNQFLPISLKETGVAFSPLLSNITLLRLGGDLSLVPSLRVGADAFLFFRTVAGAISEPGIDAGDSADLFLGPEVDLKAEWALFSDLKVRARLGFFLPASGSWGAFSDKDPWFKGTVEVLFSF